MYEIKIVVWVLHSMGSKLKNQKPLFILVMPKNANLPKVSLNPSGFYLGAACPNEQWTNSNIYKSLAMLQFLFLGEGGS